MITLIFLVLALAGILITFWQVKFMARDVLRLVQFNTAGTSPMQRLIPNVSYLLLFLLLLGLTMR